jgi:tetratricopeptide (TPR) repeat protein
MGAGYGWHQWRERQMASIVSAAVPPIPELAAWPREYASRVRAATAAANRAEQSLMALAELAFLYHANGCYVEAEQAERGLQAIEPKNAQWTYLLADVCEKRGDMEEQRAFLEKTLVLAPHYPTTRIRLADLLLKLGHPDEAQAHYEWRLTLVPNDPHGRLGLARIALQRGDRPGALKYLEAIVRDSPDFPAAHNLLSEIYARMGDTARSDEQRRLSGATGEWREADDPWLYKVYAWSFDPYHLDKSGDAGLQARRLEASLPFYEKAVRLAPNDGLAYDALGSVYLQLNRLDGAVTTLEAGLAKAPTTAALYSTLAKVLRKQGRVPKAIEVLLRGATALPSSPVLRYDLGAALEENGRREEAAAAYREAVRLDPDFPEAHWDLGLCLLALGQSSEARASLGRALELRPRNGDALTARAQKALDTGQLDQAACIIHALVEHGPGIPARQLIERGLAAARQAGDAKSLEDFEQLLTRTPQ